MAIQPQKRRFLHVRLSGTIKPYDPQEWEWNIPGLIITEDDNALLTTDHTVTGKWQLNNSGVEIQEAIDNALTTASQSNKGLMSMEDKIKLDALEYENWDAIPQSELDAILETIFNDGD